MTNLFSGGGSISPDIAGARNHFLLRHCQRHFKLTTLSEFRYKQGPTGHYTIQLLSPADMSTLILISANIHGILLFSNTTENIIVPSKAP